MYKNCLKHNFTHMLVTHLFKYKELKYQLKMGDHKINSYKRQKKFNKLYRMRIVYFTRRKKLHNIQPMMTAGLSTKVRSMI